MSQAPERIREAVFTREAAPRHHPRWEPGALAAPAGVVRGAEISVLTVTPRHARAFLREGQRSLAVMCLAFLCGLTWTAGPDGFRESRPYQLVGPFLAL